MPFDDIKHFRQLDSRCPGHPEYRWTSGVETTTGPLGPGRRHQRRHGDRRPVDGRPLQPTRLRDLFNFDVYALCGDGCMMEGISGEAASLAGHLQLSNLCWIYDNNHITIEGNTSLAFSDDVATRFIGYGWNVTRVGDANDLDMLGRAFRTFQRRRDRPTLIIVDSHIGYGAPHKQDTSAAHGEPLGEEEIRLTKRNYGWPEDAKFLVPDGVYEHFRNGIGKRGKELRDAWFSRVSEYKAKYPELADQLDRMQHRQLPEGWDKDLPRSPPMPRARGRANHPARCSTSLAKRRAVADRRLGRPGAVDQDPPDLRRSRRFPGGQLRGRNFHFGIREHAMGAILNGMAWSRFVPTAPAS